jgi:hypothetical protein
MEAETIDRRLSDVAAWFDMTPGTILIIDSFIDKNQVEPWLLCRVIEELIDD